MENRTDNYRIQAENARLEFLKYDQAAMTRRFVKEYDEKWMYISFFGTEYKISRDTGKVTLRNSDVEAHFETVMTIYDMLCYAKNNACLSGEWKTLVNLSPHSNFGSSGKSMFTKEAAKFSGKLTELETACIALSGVPVTKADAGFRFDAFEELPVIFQFWDGDDEFEPQISFLFDANTLDFIHFETAWYLAGHLLRLINTEMQ